MGDALMIACVVGLLLCGATVPSAAAEDARLAHPHDKDRPSDFRPDFPDRAAWARRAERLRAQVLVAQGLWPMPPKTPVEPVVHGRIDRDAYTIEKVFFASLPGHYVSGNLYRPKGRTGKVPAVLAPYGHWPDGRFVWKDDAAVRKEIDLGAEKEPNAARSPLQANAAMLARMGCVVFQYDMVGYCDSRAIPHREGFLDAEAVLRLQSFMGLQTWNSVRSLDFVLSLPEVDPARVAVTGSSSGGTQTIALNAVDDRAAVAFPMVMVSMNMQGGCACENAPLYRVRTNNVELASLFAPRPQGMAAANDWTHDFMTRGLPEMKTVWGLYGAADRVFGEHVDFGHNHNLPSRELQYAFLNEHLKLGWPQPVREEPFEPVPPAELSVYDAEHPLPADATDAAGVRRWMTETADARLAELAKDRESYAKTVRAALAAMVVDEMPTPADVEVVESSGPLPAADAEWSGFIARRGTGERVPARAVFPRNWDGTVVVRAFLDGRASAAADDPAVRALLDAGAAVVAVDPFMSDAFRPAPKAPATAPASTRPNPNPPYHGGYVLGYNRSVLAERVHDLLTLVALARGWEQTRAVHVVGTGEAGVAALIARALAGDAVDRAAIDLAGFDFDRITDPADPMLLPGALKYGGVRGFVPLCAGRPTLLAGMPGAAPGTQTPSVTTDPEARPAAALVEWLLNPR